MAFILSAFIYLKAFDEKIGDSGYFNSNMYIFICKQFRFTDENKKRGIKAECIVTVILS